MAVAPFSAQFQFLVQRACQRGKPFSNGHHSRGRGPASDMPERLRVRRDRAPHVLDPRARRLFCDRPSVGKVLGAIGNGMGIGRGQFIEASYWAMDIDKPIVVSLAGDVEVEEASEYLFDHKIPAYRRPRSKTTASPRTASASACRSCS
jgi:CoA ligase-like protein